MSESTDSLKYAVGVVSAMMRERGTEPTTKTSHQKIVH